MQDYNHEKDSQIQYGGAYGFASNDKNHLKTVPRRSIFQLLISFLMALAHIIAVTLTGFVLYNVKPGSSFFSWHPTLMTLGYGFIMYEAILLFSGSALFAKIKRPTKLNLHGLMQGTALLCIVSGLVVVYTNKDSLGKPHFVTYHAKIGAAANTLVFAVAMGGILARYASSLGGAVHPPSIRKMHAFAAAVVFSIACAAMITGMGSDYFGRIMINQPVLWRLAQALPLCSALVVLTQVVRSYAPRMRTKP